MYSLSLAPRDNRNDILFRSDSSGILFETGSESKSKLLSIFRKLQYVVELPEDNSTNYPSSIRGQFDLQRNNKKL